MSVSDELRMRHLSDIQTVVTRQSQNSFTVRGWSVTLVSVLIAVLYGNSVNLREKTLFALVPALIFWWLDAYYLRQERLFRALYQAVATRIVQGDSVPDVRPFDMDISPYLREVPSTIRTLLVTQVWSIPLTLVLLVLSFAALR